MDHIMRVKIGSLTVPEGCKRWSYDLKLEGSQLTLKVSYFPPGYVAWDPHNDQFIDQYLLQDDYALEYRHSHVNLDALLNDEPVKIRGRFGCLLEDKEFTYEEIDKSDFERVIFRSGAQGVFCAIGDDVYLRYLKKKSGGTEHG